MIVERETRAAEGRALLVALAVAVLPYVLLAAYAYPSADDFDYAMDTRLEGYWTAFAHQYAGWNGRFASNLLVLANPMVQGSVGVYRMVAVGVLMVTVAAMYAFVRALAGSSFDRRITAVCALAWCGVHLSVVPALAENFYWYTGAVTYQLSTALLIGQFAAVVRLLRRRNAGAWSIIAVAAPLALIVGMNEVVMLLAVAAYTALTAFAAARRDRYGVTVSLACVAAGVLGGLAVALSPGNAVRGALYPVRHELIQSAAITAVQTVRFAAAWSTAGPLLLATALLVPVARRIAAAHPFWRGLSRSEFVAVLVAPFVAIPIGIFPAVWSTGVLGQHRTVSVAFAVFLVLWFVATIAVTARFELTMPAPLLAPAAAGLVAAVIFTGNGYSVTTDLMTGRARRYAVAMAARSAAFVACGQTPARTCPIEALADSLHALSVSSGSADAAWAVQSHARYFGVTLFEMKPARSDVRY